MAGFRLGMTLLRRGGLFVAVGLPATSEGNIEINPFDPEGTDWYGEATMRRAERAYDAWNTLEVVSERYDRKVAGSH